MDAVIDPQLMPDAHSAPPSTHIYHLDEDVLDVKPEPESHGLRLDIALAHDQDDEEMEDLFGDDQTVEPAPKQSTESPAVSGRESEELSATELKHRKDLEYEEDDGQEDAVVELKHAVLSIPNIPMPRSSDNENWVIKMPNFIKLDSKPFHPDSYVGPDQADDYAQVSSVRERTMSIKLEVENTIRWRWAKDEFGQDKRQSNSRIIRWSDGSLSLLLGKELFDITRAYDNSAKLQRRSAGVPNSQSQSQLLSQSQSQQQSSQQPQQASSQGARPQGLTYLVAQHKRPGILQAEAPITGHMSLRPTGMQSETHRMLVRAVGQKHNKIARLRFAPDPTVDPERERQELLKAAAKKPRRPRGEGEGGTRRRRYAGGRSRRGESVWSDEEPEATFMGTDDDEEEAYGGAARGGRKHAREGASDAAGTRKGSGEYQTDDFLVADSSEGEGDGDHGSDESSPRKRQKKKKRRMRGDHEGDGEVDALDEIDARIARQEESRRKRKAQTPQTQVSPERSQEPGNAVGDSGEAQGGAGDDVKMDIESEEDEGEDEEFKVRRAGTGSRKKRTIAVDEEEEE